MIDPNTILSCFSDEKTLLEALHEIKQYLIQVDEALKQNDVIRQAVLQAGEDHRVYIVDEYTAERLSKKLPINLKLGDEYASILYPSLLYPEPNTDIMVGYFGLIELQAQPQIKIGVTRVSFYYSEVAGKWFYNYVYKGDIFQ